MDIQFSLPHVFSPRSSQAEDAAVLRILLESLVAVNRVYVRSHPVKSLYRSGVVYGRTRVWEPIPAMYRRGFGDCKSLTAARIAELREAGVDCRPVFRFRSRSDGYKDYHILVLKNDVEGKLWEDPSKILGMGRNENARM